MKNRYEWMNALRFSVIARAVAGAMGSAWAFVVAMLVVIIWGVTGPIFGYSDTWQLVINTGTTIVTFLMVFLIQNTQNRDSRALHLKLDELLKSVDRARIQLIDVENSTDEEFDGIEHQFKSVKKRLDRQADAAAAATREVATAGGDPSPEPAANSSTHPA